MQCILFENEPETPGEWSSLWLMAQLSRKCRVEEIYEN
jgi:hypothetical protein